MKHRAFDFRTAFIDLLLNFMVSLVFIFVISSLLINPVIKKQDEGIKKNAELIIQVDWNPDIDCDVDIWVRDPFDNVVYHQQRDRGLMHIERDDLGHQNDILEMAQEYVTGVSIDNKQNQEIWVLRGKVKGEFTFNLHLFSCKVGERHARVGDASNLPVSIKIIKINPDYRVLYEETVTFTRMWQEITVLNFTLNSEGFIEKKDKSTVNLVKTKQQ